MPYIDLPTNTFRRVFTSTGLGLLFGLAVCPAASPNGQDFSVPTWSRVRFEASNFFAKTKTDISLQPAPGTELMQAPKGQPLTPDAGSVMLVTAEVQAKMPFKRKRWTGQVWFDRTTGAGFQRVRQKRGDDASRKSYRFGQEGVFRVVTRPGDGDETAPGADASRHNKHPYFPYPTPRPDCDVISDPLLLLIEASRVSANGNEHKRVCVFNKKTLYHVDLKADETKDLQTRYVLTTRDGQSSRAGPAAATRVRLTAQRVDPQAPRHEDFEFLGLEGDIAIWVDRTTSLPLAIEGELSDAGQVSFTLTAASLP